MAFRAKDEFLLDPRIVGENFRWVRTRIYNLSQAEVARLLDVGRSTISRVEDGQQLPTLDLLHRFARLMEGYYFQPVMFFVRRLSPFHTRDVCLVARYFDALYTTSDEFIVAWHVRQAAELQLLALETQQENITHFFFDHLAR